MRTTALDLLALEKNVTDVAQILRAMANEHRLMILCKLSEKGEATPGSLAEELALSQSALSQHLAKMRQEDMVISRRDGQTLWYRIADPRIGKLLNTLQRLFCTND